jgi:hypothetical protein
MKALYLLFLIAIFSTQVSAAEMTQEEFNNFCNAVPESKLRAKGAKSLCSAKIDGKFLKWMYPNTVGDIEDWVDKEVLEKIISANDATVSKEKSDEPSKKKKWSVSLKPATQAPSKTIAPSVGKSSVAITPAQVEKNQSIQKDEPANLAMSREEFVELCRTAPGAKIGGNKKNTLCRVRHRGKSLTWYFPNKIGDIATQIPSIIEEQDSDSKQKELDIGKERLAKIERRFRISPKDYNESISRTSNKEFSRLEFLEACAAFVSPSVIENSEGLVCTAVTTNMRKTWSYPDKTDGLKEELTLWVDAGCSMSKSKRFNPRCAEELRTKQYQLDSQVREEQQIAEARRQEDLWKSKRDQIIAEAKSEGRLYGFVPMNKPVEQFVKGGLSSSSTGSFLKLKKFGGLNWTLRAGCVSPDGCEKDSEINTIYWIRASTNTPLCDDIDRTLDVGMKNTPEAKILAAQGRLQEYLDHPETKKKISTAKKMCAATEVKLSSDELDRIKGSLDKKYKLIEEDTADSEYDNSLKIEKVIYSNNGDRVEFVRYYNSKLLGSDETTHLHITYNSKEDLSKDKILRERRINKAKAKEQKSQSEQDNF